jgi:predicted Zn-dependent protease
MMNGTIRNGICGAVALALTATSPLRAADDEAAAVEDAPTSAYQQALLAYKAGHFDDAKKAIDDAQKDNPNNLAVDVLKARILTDLHDYAGGEELLHQHLTENGPVDVQIALGDLYLHKHDFNRAATILDLALHLKPGDPDIELRLVYAKVNTGDTVGAFTLAAKLQPKDPVNPAYYFARAAIANASGDSAGADEDIQTVRTIYGITVANFYLKNYLAVFSSSARDSVNARAAPPPANVPPATPGQP